MKTFIGTKIVNAAPISRADYNSLRGWTLPADENGADEGYLVEYTDGGKPNMPGFAGYVSWSPKAQFEGAYLSIGDVSDLPPHQQRVVAEKAELDDNIAKLNVFMNGEKFHIVCVEAEKIRLIRQYNAMTEYSQVLGERIKSFRAETSEGKQAPSNSPFGGPTLLQQARDLLTAVEKLPPSCDASRMSGLVAEVSFGMQRLQTICNHFWPGVGELPKTPQSPE